MNPVIYHKGTEPFVNLGLILVELEPDDLNCKLSVVFAVHIELVHFP